MKFLLFFLIFFLSFCSLTALNETEGVIYAENTGEVWLESNDTIVEPEKICEEQLQLLLDEYNNLTKDYHEGASCGTVVYLLKDNNLFCGENLKNCREDVGKYRFGFWFFATLLIVIAIILLYKISSKSKQEVK